MTMRISKSLIAAGTIALGLGAALGSANAAVTFTAGVGALPSGGNVYVNFDDLALGNAGGLSGGAIGVSYTGSGETVVGSTGTYAAPWISGNNGVPFGDLTNNAADSTNYLSTGIGTVTLTLPTIKYIGLLWGSIDNYNTLQLYSGATLLGTITGTDVAGSPTGDRGVNGTYYVNINSDIAFDKVVAISTQYAFEFDNVAFNRDTVTEAVPEPTTLALFGAGLAGLYARRRRHAKA